MSRVSIHSLGRSLDASWVLYAVCGAKFSFKWDKSAKVNKRNEDAAAVADVDDDEYDTQGRLLYRINIVARPSNVFQFLARMHVVIAVDAVVVVIRLLSPAFIELLADFIYYLLSKMSLTHSIRCLFFSISFVMVSSTRAPVDSPLLFARCVGTDTANKISHALLPDTISHHICFFI